MNETIQPIKLKLNSVDITNFAPITGMDPNFVVYTPTQYKEINESELKNYNLIIPNTSVNQYNPPISLNFSRDDCSSIDNLFNLYYLISKIGFINPRVEQAIPNIKSNLQKYRLSYEQSMPMQGGFNNSCIFYQIINQGPYLISQLPQFRYNPNSNKMNKYLKEINSLTSNPFFYLVCDGSFYYFARFEYTTSFFRTFVRVKSIVRITKPIYSYIIDVLEKVKISYAGLDSLINNWKSNLNLISSTNPNNKLVLSPPAAGGNSRKSKK